MSDLHTRYLKLKVKRDICENTIKTNLHKKIDLNKKIASYEKARWLFAELAKQAQTSLKDKIESLITMVLQSLFPEREFTFELKFEHSRNKMECTPVILENGEEFYPKDELGGSTLNAIAFAARCVLLCLTKPALRRVIIMDEPFLGIDKMRLVEVAELLKTISHDLNIQLILITHETQLTEIADMVINLNEL